jgi:hypothetical protein
MNAKRTHTKGTLRQAQGMLYFFKNVRTADYEFQTQERIIGGNSFDFPARNLEYYCFLKEFNYINNFNQ